MTQRETSPDQAHGERWSAYAVMAAVVYTAWMVDGLRSPNWTVPLFVWLAVWSGLVLASSFLHRLGIVHIRFFSAVRQGIFRDPFFYTALLLLVFIGLQWANAWWPHAFGPAEPLTLWFEGSARYGGLPAAVSGPSARLFFIQMATASVVALSIRHGLRTRRAVRHLFQMLVLQACILSAFGLLQYATGTHRLFGILPRSRHFFASFYYENHAAQFFYLSLCLAVGLGLHRLCDQRNIFDRKMIRYGFAALTILYLGAVFSLSRTGIFFACAIMAVGLYHLLRGFPSDVSPMLRLRWTAGLLALCIAGLVIVSGTIGRDMREDFARTRPGQSMVGQAYEKRVWQWEAALDIWRSSPIYGVGTDGFRFYVPFYTPERYLSVLNRDHAGQAHNDPLQFLCEQGLVGGGLLAAWFALLLLPLRDPRAWKKELLLFPSLGVCLVLAHSLWDLPFRSPGVMMLWVATLAGIDRYLKLTPTNREYGKTRDKTWR